MQNVPEAYREPALQFYSTLPDMPQMPEIEQQDEKFEQDTPQRDAATSGPNSTGATQSN